MNPGFRMVVGAIVLSSACAAQAAVVLYDNGPLVTHPGGGAGGADASALQTVQGMDNFGFGHQLLGNPGNNRVADDFTVPTGGWSIDDIVFFAYQTGSGTTSTITGVNYRIWDGVPGAVGSNVVFGDDSTNRLLSSAWSNILRVLDTDLSDTTRPVMAVTAGANVTLAAGTYWLDWQVDGTLSSGPWAPPISILGQIATGNGLQSVSGGPWVALLDIGTYSQQGLPFQLLGDDGGNGTVPEPGTLALLGLGLAGLAARRRRKQQ